MEARKYDGGILPGVPLPVVSKDINLDISYMRKLAIRRRHGVEWLVMLDPS